MVPVVDAFVFSSFLPNPELRISVVSELNAPLPASAQGELPAMRKSLLGFTNFGFMVMVFASVVTPE